MVDKTNSNNADSTAEDDAQKSSEELFLRGSEQDGALRDKSDNDGLKLDDSQEELALQNIQRGSEQREIVDRGSIEKGEGVGHDGAVDVKSLSPKQSAQSNTANAEENHTDAEKTFFPSSSNNETGNNTQKLVSDNDDQDSRRVLLNSEERGGQSEGIQVAASANEIPFTDSAVNDAEETTPNNISDEKIEDLANRAPDAGDATVLSVDEGSPMLSGQIEATDANSSDVLSYQVIEGSNIPDGFSFSGDGSWQFDAQDEAYDYLNVGDSVVFTIPVIVSDNQGASDTTFIQITVSGTNDAPVAGASVSTDVDEGAGSINGQLTATDLDDGATITYAVSEGSATPDGFILNADGSYSFDPSDNAYEYLNVGASEELSIPVTVRDENGATDTTLITITVAGTNDAPIVSSTTTIQRIEENLDGFTGYGETWSGEVYSVITQEEMLQHLNISDVDSSDFTVTLTNTDDGSNWHGGLSAIDSTFSNVTSNNYDETVIQVTQAFLDNYPQIEAEVGDFYFDNVEFDQLNDGDIASISFSIQVSDGDAVSESQIINIEVIGTNDAPVIQAEVFSANEGSSLISGQLDSSDVDDGSTATFSISGGNTAPDGFILNADGSYSFDPAEGVYDYLNVGDSEVLTIPVTVTDDNGATDTAQIQITVTGTNDAPTAIDFTGTTVDENATAGTVVAQMATQDVDDGETFTYAITEDASGLFEISGDQILVKDGADIDFEAGASHDVMVQVTDANGLSYTQTVSLTVNDINEAPTDIVFAGGSIDENSGAGSVVATLTTVDEDSVESFSYSLTDDSGLFEIAGNNIVVKSSADIDFESAESHDISVDVTDSSGNTYSENFTINVNDIVENFSPDAVNDISDSFIPENASLTAEFNFDQGVPAASLGAVSTDTDGQVGDSANFNSAKVEVSDLALNGEAGAQTTVSMWIQANPEGGWEMLVASDRYDMVMLNGDIGFNTAGGDLFGTDASELADGEWHQIVGVFTNGDVTQNTIYIDGVEQEMSQIQGTPNNSVANIDSSSGSLHFGSWGANDNYRFSGSMDEVKVYDGVLSNTEITQLYNLEADNLSWNDGALSTQEDTTLTINSSELLANDTDPDGDTLTISSVEAGEHGTVELDAEGNVQFTPEENYNGAASFSYTVSDSNGGEDTATVTLNVSSVNDVPTIDVVNTISVDEDGSQKITYTVSDIDSSNVALTGEATNGDVVVNGDGSVTFTPNENYFGEDTITLTATDSDGGVSTQEISVTANPVEDAPDAVDDGSFEPQTATLTAEFNFDDGVPAASLGTVSTDTDGQVGDSADFNSAKVKVSDLALNGEAGAQTTVSMWIQANPEGGWEMLVASDRYDMVMLNGDIGFNTAGGDLFGTDASELADGEWHQIVGVFTNGDVTQNTIYIDGVEQEMSQIQGTPNNSVANIDSSSGSLHFGSWGANDNYRFSGSMDEVKVYDGVLSNDEINQLHDLESANQKWDANTLTTDEDVALVIAPASLLANDSDVDGDVITITSVQDAQNGSVEIDGDGNVVFTPLENYNGEATFTYTINDGNGNTDTATATLDVVSVEDAPTQITMTGGSIDENSAADVVVATLDAIDGDSGESFSYVLTDDVSELFEISGNEIIVKEGADIDFETVQSHDVTVQVTDSTGNQYTQTLTLDVNDIVENTAPSLVDDTTMQTTFDLPPGGRIVSTDDDGVVVAGEIVSEGDALSSVDQWTFNHDGGSLTIDVLTESGDSFIDIDGDGAKDHIDTMMRLYDEDGNLVIVNDDSAQGTADGSTNDFYSHIQDSYISIEDLPAGEYQLAIGSWELTDAEVAADQNDNSDKGRGYNIEQDVGPYQIKITGDVSFETIVDLTTDEDSSLIIDVLANDSDSDGDALVITDPGIATDADGNVVGTTEVIEVEGSQQIQFTPNATLNAMAEGENEIITFSYTVSDGNGGTEQANVTVNITGSNDAITAVVDTDAADNSVLENVAIGSYTGVTLEAIDADGEVVTYAIDNDVPFTIDSDGRVITDNALDFESTESYTFDVTATSADGTTSTNSFTVNVSDIEENTEIRGTWRSETINGTEGNDVIYGEGGNDRINASDGNDVLVGGRGNDTLYGGAGDDTFIQNEGDGNDAFFGGEGTDTITRGAGDGDIGIAGNFGASNSIENIDAGGNDVVGDWRSQTLDFSETDLEDVGQIRGEGGNDKITGTAGDDTIVGGRGSDTLNGGAGDDTFIQNEGDGNDAFFGGEGTDTITRGAGDGDIGIAGNFGASNSIENIDAGGNDVVGDWRSQTLDFSETELEDVEQIRGEGGNDKITGSSADDTISGGSGNDDLSGGAGDDVLIGGSGNDTASGGEGNDTYVMNPFDGSDYFSGGEGGGWIDTIDVSEIAANDPDNPWTLVVDGMQVEYDLAAGALELNPEAAGVVSFNDGSELSFDGVERIEW